MKSKSIDEYFEAARSIKVAMSFEEVQALVTIKGVTPPKKPWWTTKNLLIMTTTLIISTASIFLLNTPTEVTTVSENETPIIETKEELPKQDIDQTFMEPVVEPEHTTVAPLNANEEYIPENVENIKATSIPGANPTPELNNELVVLPDFDSLQAMQSEPEVPDTAKKRVKENVTYDSNSKTIEKTLELSDVDWVKVTNSKGDININTWDRETVKLVAYVSVDGNKEEDVQTALNNLDVSMIQRGRKVEIKNSSGGEDECGCTTTTIIRNGKVKFGNGETAKIKKIDVDYEISIPKDMNLDLKVSYGDMEVASFNGELKASAMQGDISTGNVTGKIDISQKYGDLTMGDYEEGEIYLFHGDADLGKSKELELDAKYSKARIDEVGELELELFQSNLEVYEGVNELEGIVKYGDIEIEGDAKNIELESFHGKLIAENIKSLEINGSYSTVKAVKIADVDLERSFNDKYDVVEVGQIIGSAKYSNIDIEYLESKLDLEMFNGSLDVDEVNSGFESLKIESKYTGIDVDFQEESKFNLEANTSYTSFDFPEEDVKVEFKSEQNSQLELKGIFNESSSKEPSIVTMNCFQGRVNFR